MKKILLGILFTCVSFAALADVVKLKDNHPNSYVVKKGDTLWDISTMFLHDPWLWPDIWHINPQIANPHLIYPGDKLTLVMVDGQIKLTVDERGPVKLLPEMRTEPIDAAIPPIPLEKISAFLSKSRILDSEKELEQAPYVLAGENRRIITGAGDTVYARGKFDKEETIFGIYRQGDAYQDPETKEILGIQARDIATVRMTSLNSDIATLIINRSAEEIRINDRLLRSENTNLASSFVPKAPNEKVKGQIIAVDGAVRNAGNMSVVVINRGTREGLEAGDVLDIAKKGEVVRDRVKKETVQLPDHKVGLLIVFRAFEKLSLGLVLRTNVALTVGDTVKSPN